MGIAMSDYDDGSGMRNDEKESSEDAETRRGFSLRNWRETLTEVGADVRDFSRSNPGTILVGALALGALLGFSLRGKRDDR